MNKNISTDSEYCPRPQPNLCLYQILKFIYGTVKKLYLSKYIYNYIYANIVTSEAISSNPSICLLFSF